MKFLKFLGIILLVIIIISFLLPKEANVERSTEVEATASEVFAQVNNLKNWNNWSPWMERDPNMELSYGEKFIGEGGSYSWTSEVEGVGSGTLEIVESVENESVKTAIDFGEMGTANGYWKLDENGDKTKVTWGFNTSTTSPPVIGKFFGLMMDKWVGADFEKGLATLKEHVESTEPVAENRMGEIEIIDGEEMMLYSIREQMPMEDYGSEVYERNYGALGKYCAENGIEMAGMPLAVFHSWGENVDMECAFRVNEHTAEGNDQVKPTKIESGKVVRMIAYGPYEGLESAHMQIDEYLKENGLEINGPVYEIYANDPGEVAPADVETHIHYPVAM